MDMIIEKRETCGIKYKYCDCFYEYTNFKDDLLNTNVRVVKKKLISPNLMKG